MAYHNPKDRPNMGGNCRKSLPLMPIALYGGVARNSIANRAIVMRYAKGIFAKGISACITLFPFAVGKRVRDSETPSCDWEKGLRLPRSSCSEIGNEGVSDPFPHRKRESQTLLPTVKGKTLYIPKSP